MLVSTICGVFGDCVAIACVGIVQNQPVLDRVGGYGTKHKKEGFLCWVFFLMG